MSHTMLRLYTRCTTHHCCFSALSTPTKSLTSLSINRNSNVLSRYSEIKLNFQNYRAVSFWGSSKRTEWNKAVSEAEKIIGYPPSYMSLRCLLSDELSNVAMQLKRLVGTRHPLLKTTRKFFDDKQSMQTRGILVLLVSKAAGPRIGHSDTMVSGIYQSQRNLAEITEMIDTANLIHKGMMNMDTIHPSDGPRDDMEFGNRMTVLIGDFLLANVSVGLADLKNTYVVEMISSAIGDLMKAEFTSLRDRNGNPVLPREGATINDWQQQTFLSSGSLIAKSCQSALMLAGHDEELQKAAHRFGCHVAYAHQVYDDLQPLNRRLWEDNGASITVTSAPVLLHVSSHRDDPWVKELLSTGTMSSAKVLKMLKGSSAVEEAKQLCFSHGQKALDTLEHFSDSKAKTALQNIVKAVTAV